MNLIALREAVAGHIHAMTGRHKDLDDDFSRLGLPDDGQGGTKAERLQRCTEQLRDEDLAALAETILEHGDPHPATRNQMQDLLWEDLPPTPELSLRVRRELADALNVDELYSEPDGFYRLLDQLWVLDAHDGTAPDWPFPPPTVRDGIEQHVVRNQDWSANELFTKLGALRAPDRRFALFLEGLASGEVQPDQDRRRRFVHTVNDQLRPVGAALTETGTVDGYPAFTLSGRGQSTRRPKQIIFAAIGRKPDLRFRSAIDNNIEIVDGIERVLTYPRQVGAQGLLWSALQQWWAAECDESDETAAKTGLYKRLVSALPTSSPPQREFFAAYHRVFSHHIQQLPALLPEVWFCWDPKSVAVRGRDALVGSRMDFLLLLPGPQRVVIEVDGPHHYIDDRGQPARRTYAGDVANDRGLTLSGYQVYRFSTDEAHHSRARRTHRGGVLPSPVPALSTTRRLST